MRLLLDSEARRDLLPACDVTNGIAYSPEKHAWQKPRRHRAAVRGQRASTVVSPDTSPPTGPEHPFEREIAERIGGDVARDLGDGVARGDELTPCRRVDPVVARPLRRWARDAEVHLARAGVADHLHDLPRRSCRGRSESSAHDDALAAQTIGSTGFSFKRTPNWRIDCCGSMKVRPT